MLVEFSVGNFRSFAERQTLSLVGGGGKMDSADYWMPTGNSQAPSLLKAACIFGSNGSGKSAFLLALDFFQDFVIDSAKSTQEGEKIDVVPFRLDKFFADQPSEFEIIFIVDDALYQYGFSTTSTAISEEWLFVRSNQPKARAKELFHRKRVSDKGDYEWRFHSRDLRGRKELWRDSTRDNALFFSTAVQLKSEDLKVPFDWIRLQLRPVLSPESFPPTVTTKYCRDDDQKNEILSILRSADLGIHDVNLYTESVMPLDYFKSLLVDSVKGMPLNLKIVDVQTDGDGDQTQEFINVKMVHKARTGENVEVEYGDESDGTKVIFNLAGPWMESLKNGYVLFIDELHNSLHPHALRFLVSTFMNPRLNTGNGQLVFTSHETSIMARQFLHRDQIWLMEKENGATCLFPLSDFKVREYEAFQKAYLDGRYGAVPRIREFADGEA